MVVASTIPFEKRFDDAEWAAFEFRRAQHIYDAVMESKTRLLRIARPLRCEGCSMFYERVPDAYRLRDVLCSGRSALSAFRQTGQAVGELHEALNPDKDLLADVCEIHGDFWTGDVLFSRSTEGIYLVDFAPPMAGPRAKAKGYCRDRVYRDLAGIITDIRVKYPLGKVYLIGRPANRLLVNEFIGGYEAQIGTSIAEEVLANHMVRTLLEMQAVMGGTGILRGAVWKLLMTPFVAHYKRQGSEGEQRA